MLFNLKNVPISDVFKPTLDCLFFIHNGYPDTSKC